MTLADAFLQCCSPLVPDLRHYAIVEILYWLPFESVEVEDLADQQIELVVAVDELRDCFEDLTVVNGHVLLVLPDDILYLFAE